MNAKTKKKKNKWMFWGISLPVLVTGALFAANIQKPSNNGSLPIDQPIFEVVKGPLTISVTESGTIKAREQEILKSEIEGRATILTLVPEGIEVKKGDLLVELDASALIDLRVDQLIYVQNAEAAYIQARENLEVVKNQAASDVDLASLTLYFARQDLGIYSAGEFPKLLTEAESKITLASSELYKATEELRWSRILYDEEFLSQTKLQESELAAQTAGHSLLLAKVDKELLTNYTYHRDIKQKESDAKQAEMALERALRVARAVVIDASAALLARESEYKRQEDKLAKLEEQIGKAKIYAPTDGLVIYATSAQFSFRGNTEPLDEGQEVHERQELIHLPTTSSVKVELKLHESNLDKVNEGLPVRVIVEAVPGEIYTGTVAKISPLPDAQSMYMNPDLKVYATELYLNGDASELRTGMSCRAEILIDYFEDTTYVPIQSIILIKGEPTVFVYNGTEFEPRKVETGLDNNRMIHIAKGLEPGEKVLLTPPLELGEIKEGEVGNGLSEQESALLESINTSSEPERKVSEERRSRRGEGERGGGPPNRRRGEGEEGETRRPRGGPGGTDREEMRRRFENMTPEQREQMRNQRRNRGGGQ